MTRNLPLSITQAGGIVGFLNQSDKVAAHKGFTGDDLTVIMSNPHTSDKVKRIDIRERSGVRSWHTVNSWIKRWRLDHAD